jgi:hypothetical protein
MDFYHQMQSEQRMTVIDCNQFPTLENIYMFSLPPMSKLHRKLPFKSTKCLATCNVGGGPGLLFETHRHPNILAIVIRNATQLLMERSGAFFQQRTQYTAPFMPDKFIFQRRTV